MSIVLAIDTSAELCSVCLVLYGEGGRREFVKSEPAARSHAQRLLPMIRGVLSEASAELEDVDLIAYGRGPGSFTGLRIAAGMVQGLAYGKDIPTLGVSNLACIADFAFSRNSSSSCCLTMIDARMHEVYWGLYRRCAKGGVQLLGNELVGPPGSVSLPEEANEFVAAGSGLSYQAELQALMAVPQIDLAEFVPAQNVAALAINRSDDSNIIQADQAGPIYIRDEVTWKKLPGRE